MDLIDRQAAIDGLEEPCKVPDSWTDEYAVGERAQWEKDVKALNSLPSAERHEQITSEMDETFRIASEIRLAVGCNTARECWELARKCDIKRVKHGRWNELPYSYECSVCGIIRPKEMTGKWHYCPNCGAKNDE